MGKGRPRTISGSMTQVTVWYDGQCPLCIREIALMRRMDKAGAITFLDAADEAISCPLDRQLILARFHAREGDNLLSGAAAFAAMWRAIPALRPLGQLARNGVLLAIMEGAYRMFLKVRPLLQRITPPVRSR